MIPKTPLHIPTPDAERKLFHAPSLLSAANRLCTSKTATEIKDALNSLKYWIEVIEKC